MKTININKNLKLVACLVLFIMFGALCYSYGYDQGVADNKLTAIDIKKPSCPPNKIKEVKFRDCADSSIENEKEKEDGSKKEEVYISKMLPSPKGDKTFYFRSYSSDVSNKNILRKNKYGSYFFSFNDNIRFCIEKDDCESAKIKPMVKFKNAGIEKNYSSIFEKYDTPIGRTYMLGWKNNKELIFYNGVGDATISSESILSLNTNNSAVRTIYNFTYESFNDKKSRFDRVGYLSFDKYYLVRKCKNIDKNNCVGTIEAYKAGDKIEKSKRDLIRYLKKNGKILDKAQKIDSFIVNLDSEFNIENIEKKVKINIGKKNIVFDFNKEKFIKIN